jgi:hypothetical protein
MADGTVYGESGYDPLSITKDSITVDITAEKDGNSAFAYLDANNAGLGVCGNVTNTGPQGESGTNVCLNANGGQAAGDDNVTTDELLQFVFSVDVLVEEISFNNNHDGGFGAGDLLDIDEDPTNAVPGYSDIGWIIGAGDIFEVSFNNEQFYVEEIVFSKITKRVQSQAFWLCWLPVWLLVVSFAEEILEHYPFTV